MQIQSLQWLDDSRKIMRVVLSSGLVVCCGFPSESWADEFIQSAIDSGKLVLDTDPPPPPTRDQIDAAAAKSYAKLNALMQMSPDQVKAWVAANVTNLAQAQDAIATLAIAVSVLARNL